MTEAIQAFEQGKGEQQVGLPRSLGISSKQVWVHFRLINPSRRNRFLNVQYPDPRIGALSIYHYWYENLDDDNAGQELKVEQGLKVDQERVESFYFSSDLKSKDWQTHSLRPTFTVTIGDTLQHDFYVSINFRPNSFAPGPLFSELTLWQEDAHVTDNQRASGILGLLTGAMLVVFITMALTGILFRSRLYCYYAAYIFALSLTFGTHYGIIPSALMPFVTLGAYHPIFIGLFFASGALLVKTYLNTAKYQPWMNIGLQCFMVFGGLVIVLHLLGLEKIMIPMALMAGSGIIFYLIACIRELKNNIPGLWFFYCCVGYLFYLNYHHVYFT